MTTFNYPPEFDEDEDQPVFGEDACEPDEHWFTRDPYCGVKVCAYCEYHEGIVRCYCGWAADGGDGRQQLREMGENID